MAITCENRALIIYKLCKTAADDDLKSHPSGHSQRESVTGDNAG